MSHKYAAIIKSILCLSSLKCVATINRLNYRAQESKEKEERKKKKQYMTVTYQLL